MADDGHPAANKSTATSKQSIGDDGSEKKRPIFDRSMGTAAGLSKLLPTGTTLAFQTLAPSFTKAGACHKVNFAFTCGLIAFLTLLTAALNFTDSVTGTDGRTTYYGFVTSRGLRLFSGGGADLVRQSKVDKHALRVRRRKREDFLHALVSAAVFLALAFCDAGVQRCLLTPNEERPWKDLFNQLPLAVGFLASFVFIVFPTTRKGIGDDAGAWGGADKADGHGHGGGGSATMPPANQEIEAAAGKKKALEERKATTLLGVAATLSNLLPLGTTMALQTMAPSFTNGGDCADHRVYFAFTWGLIGILTLLCAVLSFIDSVTDPDGHTHYGLATSTGLWLFNNHPKHLRGRAEWERLLQTKKIRARDFLHAVVSAAVFVAVAFSDAGVQDCLVPNPKKPKLQWNWREFLALLPLAMAFLASFLFVVFPSDRKGIGEEPAFWHLQDEAGGGGETKKEQEPTQRPPPPAATEPRQAANNVGVSSLEAMAAAMSTTRVAPSSSEGGHDDGRLHQLYSAV